MARDRADTTDWTQVPIARPSITGIRTPDNRPNASAFIGGIVAGTDKADVAFAILEGIAFQFLDCVRAQEAAGVPVDQVLAVGGGARSAFWVSLIATLFDRQIAVLQNGEISACLGAAKLAECATAPERIDQILARRLPVAATIDPVPAWSDRLTERHAAFRTLPFTLG
ncbi:MAG: FGGY-family carbohydrate kinase, partial [Pseudomonadota bacterium]